MCLVLLDLSNNDNLDFAIYSTVLSKDHDFSIQEIVDNIREYTDIDINKIQERINILFKKWMNDGFLQEGLDTYRRI